MKIINHDFTLPHNPIILELQIYCKKLMLNPDCNGIVNLFDLRRRVQQHTALISFNYSDSYLEDISYQVSSHLTQEVFTVTYKGEIFIKIIARKKQFEFAFKDLDASRFN
ncbi:hypothetical protein MTO98_30710 [Mucilaginibacter sp. SMC90]|uniref:hypothetical protein n=1 Tax=Mucilaginibacter sp. SMC90 TaxID=2929803 RepID=UPI001FB2A80F|nr:hypothetical protein [Mucilaginibacter sp. SMC90]UOE48774.1 hypothetical protein MTO98_30710 [Mucilaginibacter sp. SMC90]